MANSYHSWRTGIQIDNIYPVGSIYISVASTNPGSLFGGTWEAIGGQFLIGADANYIAGDTGGSATMAHTHTLAHTHSQVATTSGGPSNNTSGSTAITVSQMPAHGHRLSYRTGVVAQGSSGMYYFDVGTAGTWHSSGPSLENTGGGGGHTHTLSSHTHSTSATTTGGASATTTSAASNENNMPPYLVVYMWKRIS